MQFGVKT